MASLTGQSIKDTYQSLLKTADNGLITNAFKGITDGSGSASGLYLRNTGVLLSGSVTISGSLLYSGSTINATVTSASYALTASYALNGGGGGSVDTGSFATTGSNVFVGNQTISGSINFGDGSVIQSTSASSGDGNGYTTLTLQPDVSLATDQYVVLDPTTPNHIHIRAGGVIDSSSAYLYLGGEKSNIVVRNLDNSFNEKHWVQINSQTGSTQHTWIFDDDGTLNVPGDIIGAGNLATTGSNTFNGNQTISGSIATNDDIIITRSVPTYWEGITVTNTNTNVAADAFYAAENSAGERAVFGIKSATNPTDADYAFFGGTKGLWLSTDTTASSGADSIIRFSAGGYTNLKMTIESDKITMSGSVEVSGSIIPATDGVSTTSSFSLGSATKAWKDIWVSNGTINFVNEAGIIQSTLSSTSEGLVISGALVVTDIVAPSGSVSSFTGSLEGTSSFALTASYALNAGVTIDTGSLLVTASVSSNTITFTKGDASTFDITVNTGSVDLSGYTTNVTFNAFTSSYNTGSFTGSLQGVAATASYYVETDPIFTAVSGTLATTGSNAFVGNQTISGSLNVTGSITGSLLGTASYAFLAETASYALTAQTASYTLVYEVTSSTLYVTSSSYSETASIAQTASYYAVPVASFSWTSNYFNLTNSTDNNVRWDTTNFNLDSNIFELSGSGTADARIHIKQPGYYEFISQVHLYDLQNNMDVLVKLTSGSDTGTLTTVSLLNDCKFSETSADQTMNGNIVVNVATPAYYSIAVNPSANSPYPSNSDNTPTRLFIKRLA